MQHFPPIEAEWKRRGRHSFTLVELLVACVVFTLIMLVLLTMVSTSSKLLQQSNGERLNREAARLLLATIGRDLENASFPANATVASPLRFRFSTTNTSAFAGLENPDAAFWQTTVAGSGANPVSGTGSTNGDIQDVGYFVQWVQIGAQAHGTLCRFQVPPSNPNSTFSTYPADLLTTSVVTNAAPGLAVTNLSAANAYKGLLADDVLGLWINLYTNDPTINPPITASTTWAATTSYSSPPTCADVSVVMIDPVLATRITSASMVTNCYTLSAACLTNPAAFITNLPAFLQPGARVFTTRVPIQTGQ